MKPEKGNMTSQPGKTCTQVAAVNVSPEVVDAGAEMTLHGTVSCTPARDLRGHKLLIKDHAGAEVGSMELTHFDDETNETDEFVVNAPLKAGPYTWSAIYEETSTPISFSVKPHTTRVVVWDVPSSVVVGERIRIKVGIKCSSECDLTKKNFEIYDDKVAQIARVTLSGDRWTGTGLYFAEVEFEVPAAEGLYTWTVKCPGSDAGLPHDEGSASFGIRVVSRPEYVVKVEAVDKDTQTPMEGVRVVMHPYRAVTDARGVAELRVAKGAYQLFVSETRYLTFGLAVEVTADITARAELELEPVLERN
jgi:hypothetical protein